MNLDKAVRFLKEDIWSLRRRDLPKISAFIIHQLRIIILTFREVSEDKIQLHASALTFYTFLSVAPLLAMIFGIAKGFGLEKALENMIMENLSGQQEIVTWLLPRSRQLLENVKGGLIASVAIVLLFWAIIMIISNVEEAFNHIWGIKKGRPLMRKISNYLSLMFILPFLLVVSSSITVVVTSELKLILAEMGLLGVFNPAISVFIKLLPYILLWLLFSFLYIFLPNLKVNLKSGILAGIIAGTIFQILQWGYINFQIAVSKYDAIYGSFIALPLFLVWLRVSWLVVLFGAEISFAHQNVDTYGFERDFSKMSHSLKQLLALRVTHLLVKGFTSGDRSWSQKKISQVLDIPILLVQEILDELLDSGVVVKIHLDEDRTAAYQPGSDTENMTLYTVMHALERHGNDNIPFLSSRELVEISESLKSFDEIIEKSSANKRLKDI